MVVLNTILFMFGKFSVHAWSQCGGWDEEQSILVHQGPITHFSTSWHAKLCLTLYELILKKFLIQTSTPTPSMHKNLPIYRKDLYAKQPTPDQTSS